MEKKQIIDFGNLEHFINEIEILFKDKQINVLEQELILSQTLNRLRSSQKNQQANDMMQNISLGGLFKRLRKAKDETD